MSLSYIRLSECKLLAFNQTQREEKVKLHLHRRDKNKMGKLMAKIQSITSITILLHRKVEEGSVTFEMRWYLSEHLEESLSEVSKKMFLKESI